MAAFPPLCDFGWNAPAFSLPGVDGKVHKLSDYDQAKVLVIVFTCNHCPTAQAYEGRIKKLAADFKDKGMALVAISPNDPEAVRLDELGYTDVGDSLEDMKIRAKAAQFNFPYLYDGLDQKVSKAYGPVTTPHVFVFDSERKLRFAGRVDNNERDPNKATSHDTRSAIEAVLAGKPSPAWRGPVPSGYGMHLVRLRAASAPRPPRLAEVRLQVENDWRAATIEAREAAAYQALLGGYAIRIEKP